MAERWLAAAIMSLGWFSAACGGGDAPTGSGAGGVGAATTGSGLQSTATTSTGAVASSTSASTGAGGAPLSCEGLSGASGDFDRTVDSGGTTRRFLLHVPESYDPAAGTELILAFHGFTEGPGEIRDTSHFDEISDARGFIVVYPEGLNGSWNGGACCGLSQFMAVDDVGFVSAILDALEAEYCVDPARVFATGFSNGGFLTEKLGCQLSDRIAALGVVAGEESLAECVPERPVPVLEIHGDADPVVPYGGDPFLGFPSTPSTVAGWVMRNGCDTDSSPGIELGDTSCEVHGACSQGASVELCTVSGGGHDWPGGGSEWSDTDPPDDFNATLRIADFFEAHPMP